jgi:VWFA-related protein
MRFGRGAWTAVGLIAVVAACVSARAQDGVLSNLPGAGFDDPAPLHSLTQARTQSSTATIKVNARETVVDVTVMGKDGKPVHGLKQSDFIVKEDGKPQSIRSFKEFARSAPATALVKPASEKLPPNLYTNRHLAPTTATTNLILIDLINVSDYMDKMRELIYAKQFAQEMPAGTQVALFKLDGGLKTLQGFTSDPALLNAAISDPKVSLLPPDMNYCSVGELNLIALRQIAAFVSAIKGKKNLIWLETGRVPLTDECDTNLEDKVFDMLASEQVAIDPVDVRGLVNPGVSSAADHLSSIGASTGVQVASATMGAYTGHAGSLLGMEALAERTGGLAYYNTNDAAKSIVRALEDGANYYTLTYAPPDAKGDGGHHTIHVDVSRPDVQLTYRKDYNAENSAPFAAATGVHTKLSSTTPDPEKNTMIASMARFAPPAMQLLFDVKVAQTTTPAKPTDPPVMGFPVDEVKSKPLTRYDVLYSLPADQIALPEIAGGVHNGELEFDVVASDVFGKLITSVSRKIQLPLTTEEYQQFITTPFQLFQQIDLPPGQVFLRVGILDSVSNKIGTVEIPLTVGNKSSTP